MGDEAGPEAGASAGAEGRGRFKGTVICGPPLSFTEVPEEGCEGDFGAGWVDGGPGGVGVAIWACKVE